MDSNSALSIARALESRSEHPIAKAFSDGVALSENSASSGSADAIDSTVHKVTNFTVTPGGGISGEINDTLFSWDLQHSAFTNHS